MAASYRLDAGGLLDRGTPLRFRFDGRAMTGLAGDTLASALLANGVRLVGRSFKYHRRRGLVGSGPDEPNALVELRTGARREPNVKATEAELFDGLEAASQNRWPSLERDAFAVNGLFSPLIVAGFYYKTFKWPPRMWEKLYEPLIRRSAGLGRAAEEADPDTYDWATAHGDVLVVGAGPAGLMAALRAARAGARVILAENDGRLGGRLLSERHEIGGEGGVAFAERVAAELASLPNVRVFTRTNVFGAYDGGMFGALERVADHLPEPGPNQVRQRAWTFVAKRTIVATGAVERPVVFSGNDLPGVMLAGAMRAYALRHAVAPGREAIVFTANDSGWLTATDLIAAGVSLRAVIDPREAVAPALRQAVEGRGAEALVGAAVVEAKGRAEVRGLEVRLASGATREIACDALGVSGGWQPSIQLTGHLGERPVYSEALAAFVSGPLPRGMAVAGAAAGSMALGACLAEGSKAGAEAAGDLGFGAMQEHRGSNLRAGESPHPPLDGEEPAPDLIRGRREAPGWGGAPGSEPAAVRFAPWSSIGKVEELIYRNAV